MFFFFQAEDGIRDIGVTGVQTCALPILRSPQDPLVAKSTEVIDKVIKVDTPNGATFYRYNHDGYGEMDDGRNWNFDGRYTGKGRLWALLAGERGQYELALGRNADAARRLEAMAGFANRSEERRV